MPPLPADLQRLVRIPRADIFAKLMEQEELLRRRGFPAISPWWLDTLRAFYQSGKRRLVLRVGRRGGKSSTICRVAVVEMIHGGHVIPPGDLGVFPIVSVLKEDAANRLQLVKALLEALGIKFGPIGDGIHGIRLDGLPFAFKTYAATVAGVSGFTGLGCLCDEMAKWRDKDTGSNPATEVLRSLKPTMATQRNARSFWCSSPFSTLDAHHEAFARGDTDEQMVAYAPTWVANPSLTEADTREDEEDLATWEREYKAIPMSSAASSFFDGAAVDAACVPGYVLPVVAQPGTFITAGGDFAFERDSSALAIAHRIGDWESARYSVGDLLEQRPAPGFPLVPGSVVSAMAASLKANKVGHLMADGVYRQSIIEHLDEHGLAFVDAPASQAGKAQTYVRARVLLNGRRLSLPTHPRLIGQLKEVVGKPTPGGGISITAPRKSGHGDLVSAMVLSLWQRNGYEVPAPEPTEQIRMEKAIEARIRKQTGEEWWER